MHIPKIIINAKDIEINKMKDPPIIGAKKYFVLASITCQAIPDTEMTKQDLKIKLIYSKNKKMRSSVLKKTISH